MNVLIRTDASVEIGSGHLMRCLTLADQLRKRDAQVAFVCRDLPGAMFGILESKGYPYVKLPMETSPLPERDAEETLHAAETLFSQGVDWLVVDHYGLDAQWERILRRVATKIMVIDDLADRPHDCNLLLDQNYYRDLEQRYQGLVPDGCISLLGPSYVLLRHEFSEARKSLRARDGKVRRMMVFFGGSDSTNQTRKALDAIKLLNRADIAVDVIVGASNPHQNEIMALCREMPYVQYHCQVGNMAGLMSASDLAIGAGGATTWERCALGLPTLTLVFADNQVQTTVDLAEFGAVEFLGWANKLSALELSRSLHHMIENPKSLRRLSERGTCLMNEWQGGEFVADSMENIISTGINK